MPHLPVAFQRRRLVSRSLYLAIGALVFFYHVVENRLLRCALGGICILSPRGLAGPHGHCRFGIYGGIELPYVQFSKTSICTSSFMRHLARHPLQAILCLIMLSSFVATHIIMAFELAIHGHQGVKLFRCQKY